MSPTNFADDEPLPSRPPPTPTTQPPATVRTIPEFPDVAAATTVSDFAVLVKFLAPPAAVTPGGRAPIDLVAVLDVSSSMSGKKLALLKRAVRFIIDQLGSSDRLSIVSFATNARRGLKLTCMSDNGRARASASVEFLTTYGFTNIKDGLETGVRILEQRRYKNLVSGIILLSDGEDNKSTRGPEADKENPYSYLLPSHKVTTQTFGFGSDHDAKAMESIARATGGIYTFIEDEEDVQDSFAIVIGGLLSVVAQQVELTVNTASPGVRITSVVSGGHSSKIISRGLATVAIGEVYADEEKDVFVHLSIPAASPQQSTMELLTVRGSYTDPLTQEEKFVKDQTAVIQRPKQRSRSAVPVNQEVDGQRNRMLVGKSMSEAYAKAEKNDLDGAKAVLNARKSELLASASAQAGDKHSHWLLAELGEIHNRMANATVYKKSGRAYVLSGMSSHTKQRAAAGAVATAAKKFVMPGGYLSRGTASVFSGIEYVLSGMSSHAKPGAAAGAVAAAAKKFVMPAWNRSWGMVIGARGGNNIGYQTPAMQQMLLKSQVYTAQNPLR